MPRYVILEHDHPQLHWDFMLEFGSLLRSWRLAERPRAGHLVSATATFDHRPLYLDYEGPVSGGRGHVVRWDAGTITWLEQTSDRVIVSLEGARLQGRAALCQVSGSNWSFVLNPSSTEQPLAKEEPCR
jgi:hypothetical protein